MSIDAVFCGLKEKVRKRKKKEKETRKEKNQKKRIKNKEINKEKEPKRNAKTCVRVKQKSKIFAHKQQSLQNTT